MADRNASDSRHILPPVAQPTPISKDSQGFDNSIPLSPQWLLPKTGESKHESGNEDEHSDSFPNNAKPMDILKSFRSSEEIVDPPKKKDVFRPSLLDHETSRLDRWRDEERDTNSSVRRDRWREGDKEHTENRKTDRWTDKSASKHYGETQRVVPDRWSDSNNKDSGQDRDRRESKWTNQWGPNDKNKEGSHEKSQESGRVSDVVYDKGLPSQFIQRKDEKEGDVYRPWRSNATHGRGRGEALSQTLTPSKGSAFSYGRGRIENQSPAFNHSHGRPNMLGSGNSLGTYAPSSRLVLDKSEVMHAESSFLSYTRAKLLDVYRTMDKRSSSKLLDGFVEVPSLTQEELSDPLGLSAPSTDEAVILMGIDKGDILSSGAPVNSKEGHAQRHVSEHSQPRRPKIGSREDLASAIDGSMDDSADDLKSGYSNHFEGDIRDKQTRHYAAQRTYRSIMPTSEEDGPLRKSGELSASRDFGVPRDTYVPPGSSWRSLSHMEHVRSPLEVRDVSNNRQSSHHDFVQSQNLKDSSDNHDNGSTYKLNYKNDSKWQIGGHPVTETQSSVFLDRNIESRMLPSQSPEDLILLYKDPQGNIQGPFSGGDIIGWYDAGYFGIDLQVRLAYAPTDQPFSLLGDVMPHLRSKARPPPGFSVPKQCDPLDVPGRLSYSNSGKLLVSSNEMDPMKNELRSMHGFSTDADNRFLESLMTGPQGYFGNNSSSVSPIGVDSGNLLFLAKKMALENQRSLAGRDTTPIISNSEIGPEGASVHPKLQSPMTDNVHPSPSQNSDILAMLQNATERPSSGLNNAASTLPNLDLFHGQNIHQPSAFNLQQQMLLAQKNPSLLNLLSQSNPLGVLKPEIISSATPQDPQALNMLQQQYLIHLHSQTPAPLQQLSMLDKLLLLQQQQKLSEQQQLLLQQNMLAQTLSESLPHQRPVGGSYGQRQPNAIPGGNISQLEYQLAQGQFNVGMQRPAPQDENSSNFHKVDPQIMQEASDPTVSTEVSKSSEAVRLLHQFSKGSTDQKTDLREQFSEPKSTIMSTMAEVADGSPSLNISASRSAEPSITTDAIFSLPSELEKHSGASLKSGEAFSSVLVVPHDDGLPKVGGTRKMNQIDVSSDRIIERDQTTEEPSKVKNTGTNESKKTVEKKSRKQKASKSSEQGKGVLETALEPHKLTETEGKDANVSERDLLPTGDDVPYSQNQTGLDMLSNMKAQQMLSGYVNVLKDTGSAVLNAEPEVAWGFPSQNSQLHSGQSAWKPAPGFKPKSLLEIQEEEKRKALAEVQTIAKASTAISTSLSTPWAGVVGNADTKTSIGIYMDVGSTDSHSERVLQPKNSKGQLHDLLAEKVVSKPNDVEMQQDNQKSSSAELLAAIHLESTDDFDFIQAKDNKKSRKKSGKSKVASSKVISVSPDASLGSSPVEKIKSSRQIPQEKETLPAVPSGPSLGDYVVWRGESANTFPSQAPAWSTDTGKAHPSKLRDILKEQEKKTPVPTQKPQSIQPAHGSVSSRSLGAPSLSKAPARPQTPSMSTQSKHVGDEDLFWGPIDSSKQDAKLSDFPQLASHSSWGAKSSTPLKGSVGGISKQKSVAGKTADNSHSSPPNSSLKGRKDGMSKQSGSEAMDFRDWCEAESVRLIGTKDTSFLQFCLKQTRAEAEILLVENLGSYDPNHEFIDKFLNYKELLPAEVLDIAFQSHNDRKSNSVQASFSSSADAEPSVKGGGKKKSKKGKKGKKVSPSVLGFNVVSNRIMMGEIQTVED